MSSRSSTASRITEDEINQLILKLQALLPQLSQRQTSRARASQILEETCSYIKKLQREVDDLSQRLSQLLDSTGVDLDSLINFVLQQ